ncbi:hypothetical protein OAA60_00705 [Porticoccaceae bacterium]|nr:hypothetical protein [Porticoccaceae bacterium]
MAEARPNVCEDTRGITALNDEGIPQAVCVLDNWSFNSCMMHIWIGNPMVFRHKFAEEVFSFVFSEESGRNKVIGITPSDNLKALKFNAHVGFRKTGTIQDGYKLGVDFIVQELNKHECRFIKDGKEEFTPSAKLRRRRKRTRRGKRKGRSPDSSPVQP